MTTTAATIPARPVPDSEQSLGSGSAGLALLRIEQARTGKGAWADAHRALRSMTRTPVTADLNSSSLYRGAPAVAYVLSVARHHGYDSALNVLDCHVAAIVRRRLAQAHQRIDQRQLAPLREYDLISGLTGLGTYLLYRHHGGELLQKVLGYLVRLTDPIEIDGQRLPGWWTDHAPDDQLSTHCPGGHANLGMAHGIAGPMTLLSAALRRDVTVNGQAEAIERICAFFDHWRTGSEHQFWWPGFITADEWRLQTIQQPGPQRPSWCYGTPGLARAQQIAGLALGDLERQGTAERALATCIADDQQLSRLGDVSVCHGWAGLIQVTYRVVTEAGTDDLADAMPRLRTRMRRHLQAHGYPGSDGLLEGDAGTHLVQQLTTDPDAPAMGWDACLLLAG